MSASNLEYVIELNSPKAAKTIIHKLKSMKIKYRRKGNTLVTKTMTPELQSYIHGVKQVRP